MNEIDELTRFRDTVPLGFTPRAEQLFRAALREEHHPQRCVVARPRNPLIRIRSSWRLSASVAAAAVLVAGVAGVIVAVRPAAPAAPGAHPVHPAHPAPAAPAGTPAELLADRASAAVLTQPAVSPGQWVYRDVEWFSPQRPAGVPKTFTEAGWETADGQVTFGNNASVGVSAGAGIPSYSQLGSLPTNPVALDTYLADLVYTGSKPPPSQVGPTAFSGIEEMLENYVLQPRLQAELYQALAAIPQVAVNSHVTAIDGQAGVAFVIPATPQSEKQEIILDASSYRFLAQASWGSNNSIDHEMVLVRMVFVGAPGSTQPSRTPPTAAELLAEQADLAVSEFRRPSLLVQPGTWVLRELATASGDRPVWATANDSEQASYANGKLEICSRSAACAKSTQWLMPAGPSYPLISPRSVELPASEQLPDAPLPLAAALNSYQTGCADIAGDCNAVNVMANMLAGYTIPEGAEGNWYLMLAEIPGVTVQRVTDVTGQADLAFRYPFTDGVTEILVNASTHKFAGFVRGGAETVVTKEVAVNGPGSSTPVVTRLRGQGN
jgi:hypothetical protein